MKDERKNIMMYTVKVNQYGTFWYKEGKRHREDGPAVEYNDGDKEWYIEDEKLSEIEFLIKTNRIKDINIKDIDNNVISQIIKHLKNELSQETIEKIVNFIFENLHLNNSDITIKDIINERIYT